MNARILLFLTGALLAIVGCSGRHDLTSVAGPEQPTHDLAYYQSHVDEIAIPDMVTMAATCDDVIAANPSASADDVRAKLFDKLREYKAQGRTAIPNAAQDIYPYNLTSAEFWLLFWSPWNASATKSASQKSIAEANTQWPGDQWQTKADAFRHSYWNCLLAKSCGISWAQKYTTAHESESPDGNDKFMDLVNNTYGRAIFSGHTSYSEAQFASTLKNASYVKVSTVYLMSYPYLVYLR